MTVVFPASMCAMTPILRKKFRSSAICMFVKLLGYYRGADVEVKGWCYKKVIVSISLPNKKYFFT